MPGTKAATALISRLSWPLHIARFCSICVRHGLLPTTLGRDTAVEGGKELFERVTAR